MKNIFKCMWFTLAAILFINLAYFLFNFSENFPIPNSLNNLTEPNILETSNKGCSNILNYKNACLDLFKHLNNPNPSLFHRPPLSKPPSDLLNEFTQNGDMPITKYFYFNDVYSDANEKETKLKEIISSMHVNGGTDIGSGMALALSLLK